MNVKEEYARMSTALIESYRTGSIAAAGFVTMMDELNRWYEKEQVRFVSIQQALKDAGVIKMGAIRSFT